MIAPVSTKRFSMLLSVALLVGGSAFVAPSLLQAQNAPPAPAAGAAPAPLDRNMGAMNCSTKQEREQFTPDSW